MYIMAVLTGGTKPDLVFRMRIGASCCETGRDVMYVEVAYTSRSETLGQRNVRYIRNIVK